MMYHRATGLKVDIVPCGPIEAPPGTLSLRGSTRQLQAFGAAVRHDIVAKFTSDTVAEFVAALGRAA